LGHTMGVTKDNTYNMKGIKSFLHTLGISPSKFRFELVQHTNMALVVFSLESPVSNQ
jgi:hypothetical protein